jgi:hypothetical protein
VNPLTQRAIRDIAVRRIWRREWSFIAKCAAIALAVVVACIWVGTHADRRCFMPEANPALRGKTFVCPPQPDGPEVG